MNLCAEIANNGSKLAIPEMLINKGFGTYKSGIPIPKSVFIHYNEKVSEFEAEIRKLGGKLIVRGSHPNDYHGFIDVVPTRRNITSYEGVVKAVEYIREFMLCQEVKEHCADWGQPYTPETAIVVQEQVSNIVGTMMRHPHTKKLEAQYNELHSGITVSFMRNDSGFQHRSNTVPNISNYKMFQIISMYKKLEQAGIDKQWAHQMEFSLKPGMFLQARPYMKFQKPTKFNLPELDHGTPCIWSDNHGKRLFGITPEKGIEMKFFAKGRRHLEAFGSADPQYTNKEYFERVTSDEKSCLVMKEKHRDSIDVGLNIGNLGAYCTPCNPENYLFHENYRLMKKARVSFIGPNYSNIDYVRLGINSATINDELKRFGDGVVVFSNGMKGMIVPADAV
jgi:hypothetical protein